ncbi:hypothetical protein BGX38DRAFT_1191320 [Terfezia claveryi]|nr:hypothetical protein BGX38DRAFT_1191320 [Terfezia claveryi]
MSVFPQLQCLHFHGSDVSISMAPTSLSITPTSLSTTSMCTVVDRSMLVGLCWSGAIWAAVAPQYVEVERGSSAASNGIGFYVYKYFTILLMFAILLCGTLHWA